MTAQLHLQFALFQRAKTTIPTNGTPNRRSLVSVEILIWQFRQVENILGRTKIHKNDEPKKPPNEKSILNFCSKISIFCISLVSNEIHPTFLRLEQFHVCQGAQWL